MLLAFSIRRSALLLLLPLLAGCGDQPAATQAPLIQTETQSVRSVSQQTAAPGRLTNTEYLDWKTAKLNGRLPMMTTTDAALRELGQSDSLVTPNRRDVCVSFYNKPFRYAYVNNTLMEVYGDTAIVRTIDLRRQPALTLQAGSIRLSNNTTLAELAQSFPDAVEDQYKLEKHQLGKVIAVNVATGRNISKDGWVLFFQEGRLIQIDYWMPC